MSKPIKIVCIDKVMIELIAKESGQTLIDVAGGAYNTAAGDRFNAGFI